MTEIAKSGAEYFIQDIALNHITNKKLLLDIVLNGISNQIKVTAAFKVHDKRILKNLIGELKDDWLRFKIASFIDDRDILRDLALHADDTFIKKRAELRLHNMD